MKVKSHKKLANGDYVLEIEVSEGDVRTFNWGAVALDKKGKPVASDQEHEAMQLREAAALLEDEGKTQ